MFMVVFDIKPVCCRKLGLSICPAKNYFFSKTLTSPSTILCCTVFDAMTVAL
jgi:hypothetical protein